MTTTTMSSTGKKGMYWGILLAILLVLAIGYALTRGRSETTDAIGRGTESSGVRGDSNSTTND